jgi:hypothetical protein
MDDRLYIYATAGVIVGTLLLHVVRKRFDPFAPIWMFMVGYVQIYVVQALSYREYALRVRGEEITAWANERALWSVCWFVLVYHLPIGRLLARLAPKAPTSWSLGAVGGLTPILLAWGFACGFLVSYDPTQASVEFSPEASLFLQFPILAQIAAVLLIVTGRNPARPRPALTAAGLAIAVFYIFLWMFNGRRSPALVGVLTTICAFYSSRGKRPSTMVLGITAILGAVAVTVALGWRIDRTHARSASGFVQFLADFNPADVLVNINLADREDPNRKDDKPRSYETEEIGGYLLMLSTVPDKSPFDFGSSYIRILSTYIPRIVWPDKPYYGREEWVGAWIAGSEYKRDSTFTGPAIGLLGATHLNGGATATVIVLAGLALMLRAAYEYFRLHAACPWAQAWWSLIFYNAWFMTVNDDPFVWFYYVYGHTTLPPLAFLWVFNRFNKATGDARAMPWQLGRWAQPARLGV